MTTLFPHPVQADKQVVWEEQGDDEKKILVDLFRARYHETRLKNPESFDVEQENDKIPAVVLDFEKQLEVKANVAEKQMFIHPIGGVPIDWNELPPVARAAISVMFSSPETTPEFVKTWKDKHKKMLRLRREQDIDAALAAGSDTSGKSLDHLRQIATDMAMDSQRSSVQAELLINQILEKSDDDYYQRRALYDVQLRNNAAWSTANAMFMELANRESVIEQEIADRFLVGRERLQLEHAEQMRLYEEHWDGVKTEFAQLVQTRSKPVEHSVDKARTLRRRVHDQVSRIRKYCTVKNMGTTNADGIVLAPANDRLSEAHAKYIMGVIYPLLQKAREKTPPLFNYETRQDEDMIGSFFWRHKDISNVRNMHIYRLNLLFNRYNIPKPQRYIKELAWLGSGEDNFSECVRTDMARLNADVERYREKEKAQAKQDKIIAARARDQMENPPLTTKTSPLPSTDPVSSASSSSSSSLPSLAEQTGEEEEVVVEIGRKTAQEV